MKTWKKITPERFAVLQDVEDLVICARGQMLKQGSFYEEYKTKETIDITPNSSCWNIRLRHEYDPRFGNTYFEYKL